MRATGARSASTEGGRSNARVTRNTGLQYTGTVTQEPRADETSVQDALRRQIENPEDHGLSLIEECLLDLVRGL